ncbi:MAG: SLOG family protein [Defluviicoccus sp.]|nr:SLOG family protein [Defluviicoccus sp.]
MLGIGRAEVAPTSARMGWFKEARNALEEAEALERDIPEELAAHLVDLGAPRDAVDAKNTSIEFRISFVEREGAATAGRELRARERRDPAAMPDRAEAAAPAEPLRETLNRVGAAGGSRVAVAGFVPGADREAVFSRLDGLRVAIADPCLLLDDAPGFERIAAESARDRGVEAFVFRAGDETGPDAARERNRAIVEAGPNLVIVYSDGDELGFRAGHAQERGIPVSIRGPRRNWSAPPPDPRTGTPARHSARLSGKRSVGRLLTGQQRRRAGA